MERERHAAKGMQCFIKQFCNLPDIFKKYGLSILSISRSKYVIGRFELYQKINYNPKIKPIHVSFPSEITTIDPTNLYSESAALHCALVTGMIADVLGEDALQTVSGRMSSNRFDFKLKTLTGNYVNINVNNSQVETDGGYESANQFMIVEAKNERVEDFLIRQLYYPYRLWKEKTFKEVRPVFFTYSNDIFSFFVFEFSDSMTYNSLKVISQKDFVIAHEEISLNDIIKLAHIIAIQPEPKIPFPQADNFPRIIDLLGLLADKNLDKDTITTNYDFDERQTNYYTSAGMYLGLIEKYNDIETKNNV